MATTAPIQTTGKRARTPSHKSVSETSVSTSSPENKILRSSTSPDHSETGQGQGQQRPILCTLPPTCNRQPITLVNSKELERHYAMYHAHVCEQPGCGCVFPEARLLELHQTECHDPLAAVRKERGEKIFGCLLQTCPRFFISPKARRLHMIESHKYPKEFFFAVTNKGIGGLLRRWGEGASMIRGEWKPREMDNNKKQGGKGKAKEEDAEKRMVVEEDSDDDEGSSGEEQQEVDMEELERTPRPHTRPLYPASPPRAVPTSPKHQQGTAPDVDENMDTLVEGMTSLSLVPPSIRFGRGGRGGGLGMRGRARGGRGGIITPHGDGVGHQRSASAIVSAETPLGRGRGGRGHRGGGSAGNRMEMEGSVVLSPLNGGRGRGGRGRRGGRGAP